MKLPHLSLLLFALTTNLTIKFASIESGREVLSRRDEFIAAMTPLDRRARLQAGNEVSEKELLAFIGRGVRGWTTDETNRLAGVFRNVGDELGKWELPFPETILLVKTSGEEEFNEFYTRQNAVVFPAAKLGGSPSALKHVILHELFHVLTRHDPELRRAAYGVIGFRRINEVALPEELLRRKITNPDGVENGWVIGLTNQGDAVQAVPILLATSDSFNPNAGGANPYDYFRLLVVETRDAGWSPQLVAGHPRLLKPAEVTGWVEQIGRNTGYIIHPDEILADNFVKLMMGDTNVPTPRILTDLAGVFRQRAAKKPSASPRPR